LPVNRGWLALRGRPGRLDHPVRWDLKERLACKAQRGLRACVGRLDRWDHPDHSVPREIEAKRGLRARQVSAVDQDQPGRRVHREQ
jgi:hypothetical protein